jgi:AcrR family transcriptional regulator
MAIARTPRQAWIDAGLAALAEGGPDSVRVELLAKSLGVTKGGFYGFFTDRNALLDEMLESWERRSVDEVLETVDREDAAPLRTAVRAAELTFSSDLWPVDQAVRDWARRDAGVAERLRRVDNQRMNLLRTQFASSYPDPDELEARCLLAFSAAVASDLIAADHPHRTRDDVLRHATRLLFADALKPPPPG